MLKDKILKQLTTYIAAIIILAGMVAFLSLLALISVLIWKGIFTIIGGGF